MGHLSISKCTTFLKCIVPFENFLNVFTLKADALTVRTWIERCYLSFGVQALVCCRAHQVLQKLFYCTSRVLYKCLECVSLKLPNFVCEEIVKNAACLRKGKGYHYLNQDLFGTRGQFSSSLRIELFAHRLLDSTFAASLCNLLSIFEKYLFL